MKRAFILYSLALSLLAALSFAPGAVAVGWTTQPSGTTDTLRAVAFADTTHGWAVGDNGTLLGFQLALDGTTWKPYSSGTVNSLHAVSLLDAYGGRAVGSAGTLLDLSLMISGPTWTVRSAGTTHTLYSFDWSDAPNFQSVSPWGIVIGPIGYAVGDQGAILFCSTDGTWTQQASGTSHDLRGVVFVNDSYGWAVGDQGTILATSNGNAGGIWTSQSSGTTQNLRAVGFADDGSHGWAVGDSGTILATTNGGTTWTKQTSGTTNDLAAVDFIDASRGWVVGELGTILATTNGGTTWTPQTSGTVRNLHGVDFISLSSGQYGWAVGDQGVILAYTNGASFPSIGSFAPSAGDFGDSVTLTGSGFTGASGVYFHGVSASYTVVSDTQITTAVPVGATSGTISVTTPGGTGASASSFTVTSITPVPAITGFSPTSGPVSTSVTVTGTGFTGATAVTFGGTAAISYSVVSDTQITTAVPAGATSGTISVTTPGGTGASASSFTVTTATPGPTITGFSPTSGPLGTTVTLTGTHLSGSSSVKFHGVSASYTVISDTRITTAVPAGATSGTISVTTPGGTAASASSFTVTTVTPVPTISSFSPIAGPVGTMVTLAGTHLTGATAVKFNGVSASYNVVDDTEITTTVPVAASGKISVTTAGGTVTSGDVFTVTSPKPVMSRVSPAYGKRGATVTITGTGLGLSRGASCVRFGATKVSKYVSWSNTRVKVRVPVRAKYGRLKITVTTAGGTSNAKTFTVKR
jgi:photosystem II stability/assembly factor-like uncharacterized protein